MSLSSYCRNCSATNKTIDEMAANHCAECETARQAAMTAKREADPDADPSAVLYAGREALGQRAHHPRQTFINPRDFHRRDIENK